MKKSLIICTEYPIPENSGSNIRSMNFVRILQQYGPVDIAYSYPSSDMNKGANIFGNIYHLEKINYPQNIFGRLRSLMEGRPYPIHSYSRTAENLLLKIINNNSYDYILARYIVNAYMLFKLSSKQKKRIIIDYDDLLTGSLYETLFSDSNSPYKKLCRKINRYYLKRYEKKCSALNVSLFCSEKDLKLSCNEHNNAFVIPNVYSNATFNNFDFGDGSENENILLFVGTLSYEPNIKGLEWFINSVYREFEKERKNAKLLVVGRSPTREVVELCKNAENVELHPNVPDIKEYYKQCRAVIVPILTGGGTRIKILEAALAKRPIISTDIGAEGLDLINGKEIMIFKNAGEFSLIYKELLCKERYHSLVLNAKRNVTQKYSIIKFRESMQAVLSKMDGEL